MSPSAGLIKGGVCRALSDALHYPCKVSAESLLNLARLHGIGLHGEREASPGVAHKTFHCLRSTVATMLHASGVTEGMAMELVGHKSREVHAVYLRPTTEQLRLAAQALPVL